MSTFRRLLLSLPLGALFLFSFTACVEYPNCKNDEHCAEKGEVCVANLCKNAVITASVVRGRSAQGTSVATVLATVMTLAHAQALKNAATMSVDRSASVTMSVAATSSVMRALVR